MIKYSLWNTGRTIRQNGIPFWWICDAVDSYIYDMADNHPLFNTLANAQVFLRVMLSTYNWMNPYEWVIAEYNPARDENNTKEVIGYKVNRDDFGIPTEVMKLEPK